jgi:hypothetical protein
MISAHANEHPKGEPMDSHVRVPMEMVKVETLACLVMKILFDF